MRDSRSNYKSFKDGKCRLCGGETRVFHRGPRRAFYKCIACGYIQVAAQDVPHESAERQRYLLHNNDPQDSGYLRYLTTFCNHTVFRYAEPGARLLELGSGPEPVLAGMLREAGYQVRIYDPFFADAPSVFDDQYDAVVAVEVIEHVWDPEGFFARASEVLDPGGLAFFRTELWEGSEAEFSDWWYKEDITHVGFFCRKSVDYVARTFPGKVKSIDHNCMITICKDRSDL